jgi:hypothetical protein
MTFFKGSRYEDVGEGELLDATGRLLRYKRVRLIPDTPGRFSHVVTEGERIDHVAHRYFRDSERFWPICDANAALWPPDLLGEPGALIEIPGAEGR